MKKYKLKSPAKVNLTLEVIKRLPNGYHELRSVMFKLENLYDEIELVFSEKETGIKIICSDKRVPANEKNICWKITEKFFKETDKRIGIAIKIKKRIPVAAGLGGGSSNGAAVLLALNDYFGRPLSYKKLIKIAAEIGKDIPFFLMKSKLIYVSGMGEKLLPLKASFKHSFLIVNPKIEISTSGAFKELDEKLWFMENPKRKNISRRMIAAIRNGENVSGFLYNDFDLVAKDKCPDIMTIKNALISFGAYSAGITGTGPTVFGIYKTEKETRLAKNILNKKYTKFFVEMG